MADDQVTVEMPFNTEQAQRAGAVMIAKDAVTFKSGAGFAASSSVSVEVDDLLRVAEFVFSGVHIDHDFEIAFEPEAVSDDAGE